MTEADDILISLLIFSGKRSLNRLYFISIGVIGPIVVFLKMEFCYVSMVDGVISVATSFSIKPRDSHFLICSVLFVSKGNLFDIYLHSMLIVC